MAVADQGRLLIHAPVPLFRGPDGALLLDDQACRGLALWAQNFAHVTATMPLATGAPPPNWVPLDRIGPDRDRVTLVPLPAAWRPDQFLRALGPGRAVIGEQIGRADFLSFAIGGLFGDWGAVAGLLAHRMGRPFAVWTDRVESQVVARAARDPGPWRARLRARLTHRPMAALERAVIRRAALGLFHGRETFDHYARYSSNPHVVHDVAVGAHARISTAALTAKQADTHGPLRIVYAGRAEAMKGPLDWIAALQGLAALGVAFRATWLGDGSLLPAMRARVDAAGLAGQIALPGFVNDRAALMAALTGAQVFAFCHKTPESPRCLIEALMAGTPIIGYGGAFAADLIAAHGGGDLVARDDVAGLTAALARAATDRTRLAAMIGRAAADGAGFDDVSVFAHRSALIRAHLPSA